MKPNNPKGTNKTNTNLATQFKRLVPREEVPDTLKKEVFDSLDTINLLADVLDLFTAKFSASELQFFDLLSDNLADEEFNDSDDELDLGGAAS